MKYFGIIDKNVAAIFQLQWKIGNISAIICAMWVGMIFGTRGFLLSLITNSSSKLRNSKWRMQCGGLKCAKQKVMPQRKLSSIDQYNE